MSFSLGCSSRLRQVTENETEVSFFNGELYENFRSNPQVGPFVVSSLSGDLIASLADSVGKLNFMRCSEDNIIRYVELQVSV